MTLTPSIDSIIVEHAKRLGVDRVGQFVLVDVTLDARIPTEIRYTSDMRLVLDSFRRDKMRRMATYKAEWR